MIIARAQWEGNSVVVYGLGFKEMFHNAASAKWWLRDNGYVAVGKNGVWKKEV